MTPVFNENSVSQGGLSTSTLHMTYFRRAYIRYAVEGSAETVASVEGGGAWL